MSYTGYAFVCTGYSIRQTFVGKPSQVHQHHCTHQNAPHGMNSARVFVVGRPVKWDFAFDIGNADVGIMLDKQLHMLRVIVVGTPVQGRLL